MVQPTHVEGRQTVPILIYALSICGWCRKTKALLNELGVAYDYVDVDNLSPAERDAVMEEAIKWNPAGSFPTIVIGGEECIIGFQQDKIKQAVEK